jgi:putative membrane protein
MHWSDTAWWVWIPMMLTMIVFWGLIVWLVFGRWSPVAPEDPPSAPNARAILDARLARGEITRDEYRDLRQVLESEHGAAEAERVGGMR